MPRPFVRGLRVAEVGGAAVQQWIFKAKWGLFVMLAGGCVFQTSCSSGVALSVAGLFSSIANEFIRTSVNNAFGVTSLPFSL